MPFSSSDHEFLLPFVQETVENTVCFDKQEENEFKCSSRALLPSTANTGNFIHEKKKNRAN